MAPRRPRPAEQNLSDKTQHGLTAYVLVLTALSRQLNPLCLAPVYGSFNVESPYSRALDIGALMILFGAFPFIEETVSKKWLIQAVSILGCATPTVTSYLYGYSDSMGPHWGPWISSLLPNLYLTSAALCYGVSSVRQHQKYAEFMGSVMVSTGVMFGTAYAVLVFLEQIAHVILYSAIGNSGLSSIGRYGIQLGLSCGFALLGRSRSSLFLLPMLLLAAYNAHIPFPSNIARLNANLEVEGYQLIDRRESLTGYVSVLDNVKDGFRALRCDHSLLGGEWTKYSGGYVPKLKEPIYAIFVMLEAVRLVQTETSKGVPPKLANEQQALFM